MARDRHALLQQIARAKAQVFPSLLNCDLGRVADEIAVAHSLGLPAVHWDVMDGHFVPNLTYGAGIIKDCRPKTEIFFDAHLMIDAPEKSVDEYLAAGCDNITFHLEANPAPGPLLKKIRSTGVLAGISIKPNTPVTALEPWLSQVDLILIMSVEPGFGGQKFMPAALEKIRWLSNHAPPEVVVQVDGGINQSTIADAVTAGARLLVVGSAFYGAADRAAALAGLEQVIANT